MKKTLLLILLFPYLVSAEIYQWTDANGKVHFSDEPNEQHDVKKIVPEVNTYEHVKYESPPTSVSVTSKKVVMYSTQRCGYCKKARTYFRDEGIEFVEYDIEKSKKARRRYDSFGGRGVPVIFVGKQRLNGFNVASFNRVFR